MVKLFSAAVAPLIWSPPSRSPEFTPLIIDAKREKDRDFGRLAISAAVKSTAAAGKLLSAPGPCSLTSRVSVTSAIVSLTMIDTLSPDTIRPVSVRGAKPDTSNRRCCSPGSSAIRKVPLAVVAVLRTRRLVMFVITTSILARTPPTWSTSWPTSIPGCPCAEEVSATARSPKHTKHNDSLTLQRGAGVFSGMALSSEPPRMQIQFRNGLGKTELRAVSRLENSVQLCRET